MMDKSFAQHYSITFLMVISSQDDLNKLRRALDSVFLQTYKNFTLTLIINGTLQETTLRYLSEISENHNGRVRLLNLQPQKKFEEALNFGLSQIDEEITMRLDPDDYCLPFRIERVINIFLSYDVDVLGSSILELKETVNYFFLRTYPTAEKDIYKKMLWNNQLAHSSVVFKTKKITDIGGYPSIHQQEDYGLWLICLSKNLNLMNDTSPHVVMDITGMHRRRGGIRLISSEFKLLKLKLNLKLYNPKLSILSFIIRLLYRVTPFFLKELNFRLTRNKVDLNKYINKGTLDF